jgi:hypothetical protein
MIIYDQTSIAFMRRSETLMKEILKDLGFEVGSTRFLYKRHFFPINLVVFEGTSDLGHYNANYYQIALNRKLIYTAKDSVLRDIIKHELAHYLTHIEYGQVQAHGPEFRATCSQYNFPSEIAHASINLEQANLQKEGDIDSERVLEKVKKLLQLAQSSNTHEAELATLKANALLLRHNLDHLNLNDQDEPLYMDRVLVQKRKDAKTTAIYEMLRHFIVKTVISYGKQTCCLEVSGSLTNVKLAVYIANFLDKEFDHLWEKAKKEHSLQGLRAKNSFFLGIAKGFEFKMKESKAQFSTHEQKALMVVEQDLNEKTKVIYRRLGFTRTGNNIDSHAGDIGIQSGKNLSIRQGVEGKSKGLYLSHSK